MTMARTTPASLRVIIRSAQKVSTVVTSDFMWYSIGTYLEKSPRLGQLLNKMVSSGKKLFLITNSPYSFV
jgi:hypothetical protein